MGIQLSKDKPIHRKTDKGQRVFRTSLPLSSLKGEIVTYSEKVFLIFSTAADTDFMIAGCEHPSISAICS